VEAEVEAKKLEAEKKPRKQYMPFTYSIAECLQQIADTDDSFKDVLEGTKGWKGYMEFIGERRKKLDVPPVIEQPTSGRSTGASSELLVPPTFESIANDQEQSNSYGEARDADDERFDLRDEDDMPSEDDADDYDLEQAEILLTKQEVQALA